MADPLHPADPGEGTATGPDLDKTSGTPRWVKMAAIIAAVVVVLLVVVLLTNGAGGGHGPGLHARSGDAGDLALSSYGGSDQLTLSGSHRSELAAFAAGSR